MHVIFCLNEHACMPLVLTCTCTCTYVTNVTILPITMYFCICSIPLVSYKSFMAATSDNDPSSTEGGPPPIGVVSSQEDTTVPMELPIDTQLILHIFNKAMTLGQKLVSMGRTSCSSMLN